MQHNFKDLTGKRFGRWLVKSFHGRTANTSGNFTTKFLCICDCGTEKLVNSGQLLDETSNSCGCLRQERARAARTLPEGEAAKRALLGSYKASAAKRGILWNLSDEDFFALTLQPCQYCGDLPTREWKKKYGNYTYNGVDRVNNDVGYQANNVVSCCRMCNIAKGTHSVGVFFEWIERVHALRKIARK